MEQKIFHGKVTPDDFAQSLMAHYHHGNLRVQQIGSGEKIAVQVATAQHASVGGKTAISVLLQKVEDGVAVQVGQQTWIGVAASLGLSALEALRNPWALLNRLDDIAQDMEYLQLSQEVWKVLESTALALGSGYELSQRLKRSVCLFCNTANPVGEPHCVACGAPLGNIQPRTCPRCGYVVRLAESVCPNCKNPIPA